jgi:hypothetical protein
MPAGIIRGLMNFEPGAHVGASSWMGHTIVFASDLSVLLEVPDEGGSPRAMTC